MVRYHDYGGWKPYTSAAERKRKAERETQKLKKKGHPVSPVVIEGRTIARTFWGKAWCENLERYSDFSNRLPRGRTYVRNGSVVDLQIAPGGVSAVVSGSRIYKVKVNVATVPKARWKSICNDCAGAIESLVELLQGRLSEGVMQRICQHNVGLFPAPGEIQFSCSCPDWASMCKHVAAVLYGIGARLDEQPELLFKLRKVHEEELITKAGEMLPLSKRRPAENRVLAPDHLAALFGLEMGTESEPPKMKSPRAPAKPVRRRAKTAAPKSRTARTAAKPRNRRPSTTTGKKPNAKIKPKATATIATATSKPKKKKKTTTTTTKRKPKGDRHHG